jgi:molybdopterin/thiamine biosynthesis adenylyltransferase
MEDTLLRNSRTILLKGIDFEGYNRVAKSKVLIIGAGGISSSIISILASAGVSDIAIWEDDVLELSNLQRQFIFKTADVGAKKCVLASNFITELNPDVKTTAMCKRLSQDTFKEFLEFAKNFDVLVDGTDSFTSRVLTNRSSILLKKPLFTGSAIGFEGHVYSFAGFESKNPCYSCLFGNDYEAFKEELNCANSGVFPPVPSVIGSIISQNVLYFIATKKCDFTKFTLINFNGSQHFKELAIKKDLHCEECVK